VGHGYALGFHGVAAAVIHAGVVAWEGEGVCVRKAGRDGGCIYEENVLS